MTSDPTIRGLFLYTPSVGKAYDGHQGTLKNLVQHKSDYASRMACDTDSAVHEIALNIYKY